jgi:transcriptional regulator GlxA family with amidase domain
VVLGLTRHSFVAESGIVFMPRHNLQSVPALDTLIIPGGSGLRKPETNDHICAWVKRHAGKIRRIASVCTGIYGLAPTGLLDGRRVATHWRFADDVATRYPRLKVDRNALFIKDGNFYTSAGVTAGIDLALALIEEDYGAQVALSVARELVVYFKRPGGQEQYSEPLQFQVHSSGSFADLIPWISSHLRQDLSLEVLASRANLCVRHFSRRFRETFGAPPAEFVQNMRVEEARRRLSCRDNNVQDVADSVGFGSADSFRRAFERRFGISPTAYRGRFGVSRRGQRVPAENTEVPVKMRSNSQHVSKGAR